MYNTALLIETDTALSNVLGALIKESGYSIITASSEAEAWQELLQQDELKPISIIVHDHQSSLYLSEIFWEKVLRYCETKFKKIPTIMRTQDFIQNHYSITL